MTCETDKDTIQDADQDASADPAAAPAPAPAMDLATGSVVNTTATTEDLPEDLPKYQVRVGRLGTSAPAIYLIDDPECFFDLDVIAPYCDCSIVQVCVDNWDVSLTPWPAAPTSQDDNFQGHGPQTLDALVHSWIPRIEAAASISPSARGIAGYSLAGLFSLYAFECEPAFSCVGSGSASLWYSEWCERLRNKMPAKQGGYAYLTLGSKEKRAGNPALRVVERATHETIDILQSRGTQVDFKLTTGGHFQYVDDRMTAVMNHVDAWLSKHA